MLDLRVYADALGARVSHYHDKSDLECDAIVHLEDGTSGLIGVKLGGQKLIDAAADTLKALSDKLDTSKTRTCRSAWRLSQTATSPTAGKTA